MTDAKDISGVARQCTGNEKEHFKPVIYKYDKELLDPARTYRDMVNIATNYEVGHTHTTLMSNSEAWMS